jgi:predicted Zn-dependent protease with MMP-like domain
VRRRYQTRVGRDDLTLPEFRRLVDEALDSLPQRFAAMVRNVVVSVEEEPTAEDLDVLEHEPGHEGEPDELLGIYRGVALTERGVQDPILPDEIAIFRGPILRTTRTRGAAVREIRETVIHELGHYFGLSDAEMH